MRADFWVGFELRSLLEGHILYIVTFIVDLATDQVKAECYPGQRGVKLSAVPDSAESSFALPGTVTVTTF